MIIVLKVGYTEAELNEILEFLQVKGLKVNISKGKQMCVIGVIGDVTIIDPDEILAYSYVEKVMNVSEPYKKANRLFHPADTIVDVNGSKVGGSFLGIMAGPCSVESEEQMVHREVERLVKRFDMKEICIRLSQLKKDKKLLLPESPLKAYNELVRMGLPTNKGGFEYKTFCKYYNKV